jgi:hypothetical protein
MNIKSDIDETTAKIKDLFAEEINEAEAYGYLVMYRGLELDAIRGIWTAEIDLVKDQILTPMRLIRGMR